MERRLVAYGTVNIPEGADSFPVCVRKMNLRAVQCAIAQNINKHPPGISLGHYRGSTMRVIGQDSLVIEFPIK